MGGYAFDFNYSDGENREDVDVELIKAAYKFRCRKINIGLSASHQGRRKGIPKVEPISGHDNHIHIAVYYVYKNDKGNLVFEKECQPTIIQEK